MKKKIASKSFHLKGDSARCFLVAIMSDDQLQEMDLNQSLAPEMRAALTAEMLRRDLIAGNYQI